ncbi:MAG: hypothetical protein DRN15_01795 [Thermoprotei archaeon]|nr:MAG: hypothetical protein DRN15_01795 [Thermoprotei archaeon]
MRILEKILDCLSKFKLDHADAISLDIVHHQWASRGFSNEVSKSHTNVFIVRVYVRGRWGIVVSRGCEVKPEELAKRAYKLAYTSSLQWGKGLSEGIVAQGRIFHPYRYGPGDVNDDTIIEELNALGSSLSEAGCSMAEIILDSELMVKRHIDLNDHELVEVKPLTYLTMYARVQGLGVSEIMGYTRGLEMLFDLSEKDVEPLLKRARSMLKAGVINPLIRGTHFPVILSGKVAGALIHECIGHELQADMYMLRGVKRLPVGIRIASESVTIYDDPLLRGGFGSYFADDEMIRARRKVLVEKGILLNYLHSRASALFYGHEPAGNGRGLETPPLSLMSNFILKAGDWRLEEMIEETRSGFLIDGLIRGEVDERGRCKIFVETAWYIEKGEIKGVVSPLAIEGDVRRLLHGIDAVGREMSVRISFEKGMPIAEYAPPLRISKVRII